MKKIALCLSGHLRSFKEAAPSLKKAIIDKYKPFIFMHTWVLKSFDGVRDSKEIEGISDKEIKEVYSPINTLEIENPRIFDINPYIIAHKPPELRNPQIPVSMFYGIWSANELKKEFENLVGWRFDVVIRSRPDLIFNNELDIDNFDPSAVSLPNFGDYRGYADQLAYGSSEIMDQYSNVFNVYSSYFDGSNTAARWLNAEYLLKYHLDRLKIPIKRSTIDYDILRTNGDRFKLDR
jgi:hypothetical protein